MKKLSILLFITIFLLLSAFPAFAHPAYQSNQLDTFVNYMGHVCVGSESIGWGIMEDFHLGTYICSYKFDSNVSATNKTLFRSAVALWTNNTGAQITETSSAIGTIALRDLGASVVAATTLNYSASTGHLTSWVIYINTNENITITALYLAHEIGHVFGLSDLSSSGNINKLMYYQSDFTATKPTVSDIKGFNVITGIHTVHNWKYTNAYRQCLDCDGKKTVAHQYTWTDYNSYLHRGVCSLCNEVVYEPHSPYYNTIHGCIRCGRTAFITYNTIGPDMELYE